MIGPKQSPERTEKERKILPGIDFDDNDSNPSEVSAYGSHNSDEDPNNSDDIKAWDTANEHLFSVLRLTTAGAARSVLLKFEPRNGRPGNGREGRIALKKRVLEHFSPA